MNRPFDLPKLAELIDAVRDERVSMEEIARLEEILREHEGARRYYRRAMRLYGYLEQNAVAVPPGAEVREPAEARRVPPVRTAGAEAREVAERPLIRPIGSLARSAWRRPSAGWVGTAVALGACIVVAAWFVGSALWKGSGQQAKKPDRQVDTPDPQTVASGRAWKVEPIGEPDYRALQRDRIRLEHGELLVQSTGRENGTSTLRKASLHIETPHGEVVAGGTRFLVGVHRPTEKGTPLVFKPLTRVLVLAGLVTLTNAAGSVQGAEGELLVAEAGSAPVKEVVRANSDFALDLYQHLATENAGKNVFFSPYSVSIALAMTAEGARGQTAEEMGEVLHWPRTMRHVGDGVQQIPWETAKLHSGLASLSRMLNEQQDTPKKREIRREIAALEQEVKAQKERNAPLRREDPRAYRTGVEKETQLANRLNELYGQVDQYELSVANALWGEKTYPFHPDFVKTVAGAYGTGAVRMVDFKRDFGPQRLLINGWVEDQTKKRITDLLPEGSLDALTRMVLANAIYFKGDWKTPFDAKRTKEDDFTLADGSKARVPLMQMLSMPSVRYGAFTADGALFDTPKMIGRETPKTAQYPGEDGFAMIEMSYRGGDLAMLVIAPNKADGLHEIEQRLDADKLSRWIGQLQERKVNVFLPRFKAETSYDLVETLKAMGMGSAFGMQADFSGMTLSGKRNLYISRVFHKAFVDVNEKGTEAAAATAVVMTYKGVSTTWPFTPTFRADRPFIYLIRDVRSGSILFLGRMMRP